MATGIGDREYSCERAKSLGPPKLGVCPPWKEFPTQLIIEVLIHEEVLAENSGGDQFAFCPSQARCSIIRVEFGEIGRDLKPF